MFINFKFCAVGFLFWIVISSIIRKFGKQFKVKTIREMAEIMMEQDYFKSRRNPLSVNKKEIAQVVERIFLRELSTNLKRLNKNTVIF